MERTPPAARRPLPQDTLRVSELAGRIQGALKVAFPRRIWLVGEVAELERSLRKPHWFFRLCESNPDDGKRYQLGAVIWSTEQRRLFGPGGTLAGVIEPRDGIEIRALVDLDFYPPNGDLRLVVRDVDPAYTLGVIALERQRLIDQLAREGVLALQQERVLAEVPLRIGLVSSEDSAAYNDFVQELARSGLAFRVEFFDARMQGEETVRTVLAALKALARRGVDAIALVRGGGAKTDLAWFDREEIARAIARCPVPVLCGIGHEIDTSVADLAAHLAFKTPTAAAAFLVERGQLALRALGDARATLAAVLRRLAPAAAELEAAARRLQLATNAAVELERRVLAEGARALRVQAPAFLRACARDLAVARSRVTAAAPLGAVRASLERLGDRRERLARALASSLARSAERLDARAARVRLLDPTQVLRRGYALLRRGGRVAKDAAEFTAGEAVTAELRDGALDLVVRKAKIDRCNHGGGDDEPAQGQGERPAGSGPRQLEIW